MEATPIQIWARTRSMRFAAGADVDEMAGGEIGEGLEEGGGETADNTVQARLVGER